MARRRSFRAKSKRDMQRRAASLDVPDRILIVTEGSRTEPDYFRRLIGELGLLTAQVKITGDGGSAPINVVEDGAGFLERDPDFEQIYFVFDRDRHESYGRALQKVEELNKKRAYKGKIILAATSVPCFEIWFMMHVSDSRKPYEAAKTGGSPGAALLANLKRCADFAGYTKGKCAEFDVIAPFREKAKSRAARFLKQASEEGAEEFHENPSTRVHVVVEALEKLSKTDRNA